MGSVWAIIVAAGEGRRFGRQKQFDRLGDKLVVEWSIEAARSCVDGVVLVVPADQVAAVFRGGPDRVVAGGATRSESVRAGLRAIPVEAEVILVHDAARPLATPGLFAAVVEKVRDGSPAVVPGTPVTDTIKRIEGETVVATLDRGALVAVQTPQGFSAATLREAHASRSDATDDAALVEAIGLVVMVIPGETRNRKITDRADLDFAEVLVGAKEVK